MLLTGLIESKTSSDDAENSKPEPDIVKAALDKLGMGANEVLMLGDTPYDIEAAGKLGIEVIALRCGGFTDVDLERAVAIYGDAVEFLKNYG